jgi:hypothetical protein
MSVRRLAGILLVTAAIAMSFAVAAAPAIPHARASAGSTQVPKSFRTRVERICRWATHAYERHLVDGSRAPFDPDHPTSASLRAYGRAARYRIPINNGVARRLRALPRPSTGHASWAALRQAFIASKRNNVRQINVARTGDVAAFDRVYRRTVELSQKVWQLGGAAGFSPTSPCAVL